MRGQFYSPKIKEDIKKAVMEGKSYREITEIFGVPKSTISTWFGKTLKKPMSRKAMLEHLKGARVLAVAAIKSKWKNVRDKEDAVIEKTLENELPSYPFENIGFYKSMLAMLYWAEGSKHAGVHGLHFVNTDPSLIKFYLTLLRKCYTINEKRLRARIHIHHYHSAKQAKEFWSQVSDIPLDQFGKIYLKKRSKTKKFRRNFMGICFVNYYDSKIRKELMGITKKLKTIIQ